MGKLTDYLKSVPLIELLGPKFAEFEKDYDKVLADNAALVDKLELLKAEIARLEPFEKKIAETAARQRELMAKLHAAENEVLKLKNLPPTTLILPGDLSPSKEKILQFLNSTEGAPIESIARHLRVSVERTRVLLVELQKEKFVWWKGFQDREAEWRIAQEGRNYASEHEKVA